MHVSWPFASLRIAPERLIFSTEVWKPIRAVFGLVDRALKANQQFVLEKDLVSAIHSRRGLTSASFVFEHNSSVCPAYIQFWAFRKKTVIAQLRLHGYNVVDT